VGALLVVLGFGPLLSRGIGGFVIVRQGSLDLRAVNQFCIKREESWEDPAVALCSFFTRDSDFGAIPTSMDWRKAGAVTPV
jgi:hypothetical protein